ncbi:MAG: hypothetical protein INR69_20720 [Mucilaginibacter polytrichastri]|nr:hypothetical protein [Mucilaginibacter polytrichastri]
MIYSRLMRLAACVMLCASFLTVHPVYGQVLYAKSGTVTLDWDDNTVPLISAPADILTNVL